MKEKTIRIFMLLMIMSVISLEYNISVSSRYHGLKAEAAEVYRGDRPRVAGKLVEIKRHAKETAFISWKRNPFAMQKIPGGPSVNIKLKGVVWYNDVPKAMLNDGIIVGVGDTVGSDVVVGITEDSITLKRGTKKYKIKLEY